MDWLLRLTVLCVALAHHGLATLAPDRRELQQTLMTTHRLFDRAVIGTLCRGMNASHLAFENRMFTARTNSMIVSFAIGTPPQPMRCLLDSGSSDLWVPSVRCRSCDNTQYFHADNSSTFMPHLRRTPYGDRPTPVKISYGSGEIVGYPVQDTVTIGCVQLQNQSFIIVEDAVLPPHSDWDGICGLGRKQIATAGTPVYKHMQEMGGKAVFGLVPTSDEHSFVTVGTDELEHTCQPGTLVWTEAEPVSPGRERSFWVTSGGPAIRKKTPVKTRFLVDTGTSFLLVPPRYFLGLIDSVFPAHVFREQCGVDPGAGNLVVCECSVIEAKGMLPLRVELGGREFSLDVEKLFKRVAATDGTQLCLLQIQPNPMAPQRLDPLGQLAGLLGGLPGGPFGPPLPGIGGRGSFPFPFGGDRAGGFPSPFPAGSPPGSAPAAPVAGEDGEEVQQDVETLPDGTVCVITKVFKDGKLKRHSRRCRRVVARGGSGGTSTNASETPQVEDHSTTKDTEDTQLDASPAHPTKQSLRGSRRLQLGGLDFPLPLYEDPEDGLWILGGVFLQHFVTIFDFDHARLGFCEPSDAEALDASVRLSQVEGHHGTLFSARPSSLSTTESRWYAHTLFALFIVGSTLVALFIAGSLVLARRAGPVAYAPMAAMELAPRMPMAALELVGQSEDLLTTE